MRVILIASLMLMVPLAGCSDGDGPVDEEKPPVTIGPVAKGKGVIVGVVVDDAVQTVPDATVTLVGTEEVRTTDASGNFLFKDLEPGAHFIKVTKPGYHEAQQSVEVVADVAEPPATKVLLETDPETRPYVVGPLKWSFYYECAVGFNSSATSWASATCGAEDWADPFAYPSNYEEYELDMMPTFVQSEVVWEGTGDVGSTMMLQYWAPDNSTTDGRREYSIATGASPLVLQADETMLKENDVGTEHALHLVLWASGHDEDPVSLFLNQEITVYTTVFYNTEPPEGWTFVADGVPEAS